MTDRQRKVFAAGVLLASLGANAFAHLAGCIYRPDAVVKLEIGGASKVETSKRQNVEKDRPATRPATGTAATSNSTPHPTGATDTVEGEADPVGLKLSDADRAAIEAGLRELAR